MCYTGAIKNLEDIMDIKEQIHGLSEEMIENLGKLVAIDSQLAVAKEGKPFETNPPFMEMILVCLEYAIISICPFSPCMHG